MDDLSFGTAGLRSEMDVGFNRMNEVTVRRAAMVGEFSNIVNYLFLGNWKVFEGKVSEWDCNCNRIRSPS